jgi:hypothetical protein
VVLLTREFYQEAAQRLAPGGVLASFVQLDRQKLLLRTFSEAFRYVMVLRGLRPYGGYMIGSQTPIQLRPSAILRVFGSPPVRADLARGPDFRPVPTSAWPGIIHKLIWLRNGQVSRYVGTGPILTDDHPLIEYSLLSTLSGHAHDGPVFERAAVDTGLLVLLLLLLLGGALTLEAASRHRVARRYETPPSAAGIAE